MMTQKKLRANVFDKIDSLKKKKNDDVIATEQLWMEIEQLSDTLSSIRSQIKTIEDNHNNINLRRNIQLFRNYIHNNKDDFLDL